MSDIAVTPFYLQSFVATVPGSPQPVTDFASDAPIRLQWDSNGAAFTVYAAQDAEPVYSGTATWCIISAGRTRSTTFILAASVSGGPASGTPDPSFDMIYLYDALTVTIGNPTLTPGAVTTGTLTVTGATTLNGGATAATLDVSGASTFQGQATLGDATVNGTLVTANALLSGVTTVSSTLSVMGEIAMMNPKPIPAGPYVSSADGIAIGMVGPGSELYVRCTASITGQAGVVTVMATGGTTVSYADSSGYTLSVNGNSFVLPFQGGQTWSLSVHQDGANAVPATTAFYWVPFGQNATLRAPTEDEVALLGVPPSIPHSIEVRPPVPDQAIAELVEIIGAMAGDSASPEALDGLARAVRGLVMHWA